MKIFKKLSLVALMALFISSSITAIGVGAWGGYNFSSSIDYDGVVTCQDLGANPPDQNAATIDGGNCSQGGLSFGADLWLFGLGPVQLGLGTGYIDMVSIDSTQTVNAPTTIASTGTLLTQTMIPVMAEVEVELAGFILGAGIGVGLVNNEVTSSLTYVTGKGTNTSTTISLNLIRPVVSLVAGYGFGLGPVSIKPEIRAYIVSSTKGTYPGSTDSTSFAPVTNIIPAIAFTLKI